MKLSEELIWRGFKAETTIEDPKSLDTRENKQFYWGADPSADSLTIGNLAALMMCACFVKYGYKPYLLVGGATGQIGDPKDTSERELKPLKEVEANKLAIKAQIERIMKNYLELSKASKAEKLTMVDNLDWFKNVKYLDFLRSVGKIFSMTQLMDRKFIQSRMGEGGSGISYAEFSYTLIQGYDFLHLNQEYGIDLQLCGADQFGNCSSGIHLIKRLEGKNADAWSTPLVIDPASGRKFGKSEGNAIWLAAEGTPNSTSVFDFYQFWLNQPDNAVEYLMKIYSYYPKTKIDDLMKKHKEDPSERIAQKALAKSVTSVVHGPEKAQAAIDASRILFRSHFRPSEKDLEKIQGAFPVVKRGSVLEILEKTGLAASKADARRLVRSGAISMNGEKIPYENATVTVPGLLKKGKNKFVIVKK